MLPYEAIKINGDKIMKEITLYDVQAVSGGGDVDWGAVGAGLGAVAIGVAIAATPVGWVGAAGATLFSFGGGFSIGLGISDSIETWASY